jgi:hypothetical protein
MTVASLVLSLWLIKLVMLTMERRVKQRLTPKQRRQEKAIALVNGRLHVEDKENVLRTIIRE